MTKKDAHQEEEKGTQTHPTRRGPQQKWIAKTGKEFHWPGYQYMGPGTHLAKRLKRGDPGINRLDQIAKQHDIDYSRAKNLQDKWKADTKIDPLIAYPARKPRRNAWSKKSCKPRNV